MNSIPQVELSDSELGNYRFKLADALRHIQGYNGSERAFQELMSSLIDLEQWMHRFKELEGTEEYSTNDWESAVSIAASGESRTIDGLLDESIHQLELVLEQSKSVNDVVESMNILYRHVEKVLIPPQSQEIIWGDGEGKPFEKLQFQPRLQTLIRALQEVGIYTDDLIITSGVTKENMMRKESYAHIEIPRVQREILVCNQVGEATFVSKRPLGLQTYLSKTKDELVALDGVDRIICRNLSQWAGDVITALHIEVEEQTESPIEKGAGQTSRPKIAVKDMDKLRTAIQNQISAEEWINMQTRDIPNFSCNGLKINAIASVFGMKGKPISNWQALLKLGARIFGTEEPAIKLLIELGEEPKKWAEAIREECTSKQWIDMNAAARNAFHLRRRSLRMLASLFGISKNSNYISDLEHVQLAAAIYGSDDIHVQSVLQRMIQEHQKLEELGEDSEKWATEIRKKLTADEWYAMRQPGRKALEVCEKKITAIARIFDIEGDPIRYNTVHRELGKAIFGVAYDNGQHAQALMELGKDKEKWAVAIQGRVTAEQWVNMTVKERLKFSLHGKKMTAIDRIFGLGGNPVSINSDHLALGAAIYGEDHSAIKPLIELGSDPKKWGARVREQVPAAEDWLRLKEQEKIAVKVEGVKLRKICQLFSIDGDPITHRKIFLQLGFALYEDNTSIQEELELLGRREHLRGNSEELIAEIQKKVPTGAEWASMKAGKKRALKIADCNMNWIASSLGMSGDPLKKNGVFLELGKKIYGDDADIAAAIAQVRKDAEIAEMLGNDAKRWATEIRRVVEASEDWVNMTMKEREQLEVHGKKVFALAKLLGIPYDGKSKRETFLRMGATVFGENDPVIVSELQKENGRRKRRQSE